MNILINRVIIGFLITTLFLELGLVIWIGSEGCKLPHIALYEGYSKINLRLVGKNKRVVIASKRTLSSNKELLFLLYAYPHTFSPRSVGVNTDKTWTLSSPLPPAVRYVL